MPGTEQYSTNLALGTVQVGVEYGIANRIGKPDLEQSDAILRTAWEAGIRYFDTAQAYGESESILGAFFSRNSDCIIESAKIVTKLPPDFSAHPELGLQSAVLASREKLQCERLYGLLMHREEDIRSLTPSLLHAVNQLQERGVMKHFGVSCYSPEMAKQALEMDAITTLQIPSSVFDYLRWKPVIQLAQEKEKELFIRSVYLQGLALMPPSEVPAHIPGAKDAVTYFVDFCETHQVSRDHFALAYIQHRAPCGIPVLGAENPEQVRRNSEIARKNSIGSALFDEWDRVYISPHSDFIDPSKWEVK